MNSERMQLKGQLADAEHKLRELDMRARAAITSIIAYISLGAAYEVVDRQIPEAAAQMRYLEETHMEMKALKARIAELKDALDG